MNIHPIKNETDDNNTLKEIEGLMTAKANTVKGDRLDILLTLVEGYERKHYPIEFSDPIAAIKFMMDQRGLTAKDLTPMIGQTNRVYEVLNRKRNLTLTMIKRLHKDLGIPAESLVAS